MSTGLRTCGRCGDVKPVDEFAWRRRRRLQRDNMCRPCRSAYGREHYAKNRARYISNAATLKRKRRYERTVQLIEYFESHPCVDCGQTDPVVLEFDHLGDKEFEIAAQFEARRWETVLAEIKKCEVVCSNCHRIRTADRRQSIRFRISRGLDAESG